MKSYSLIAILLFSYTSLYAQYSLAPISTDLKFSYDDLKRDDGNPNLGLLGTSMNFNLYKGFYLGPSIYSAMGGDLGGLFVIGANSGFKYPIYKGLSIDTGYFAGGGGGQNVVENPSGFMSRGHVGLSYNFRYFELGVEYSDVNYPDYGISDKQFALTFSIPGTLLIGSPEYQGDSTTDLDSVFSSRGLNFYRTFIGMYQENYFLTNSKDTQGNALDETMQLIGAKGGVFLNPNIYLGLSSAGAYDSSKNGYMDFYMMLGVQKYFTRRFFYNIEADIGSGGGGSTDTGTGLIYKSSLGLGYAFVPTFSLMLEGGYLTAPNGNFEGPFASLGLYYQFFNAGPQTFTSDVGNGQYTFEGWEISGQTERYINPQRSSNSREIENIDLAVIEVTKQINQTFSVKGQAASAYGGNAGSYATGMIGPGVQTPAWHEFRLMSDVLIGAAGGGGMDVDSGAVYQPEAGISFDVTPYISLIAKTGRIIAINGGLDATTYNAGIVFNFTNLQEGI
ncbi:MAG: hypothetical protein V4496_03755 [Pseudomonadota bacterium]